MSKHTLLDIDYWLQHFAAGLIVLCLLTFVVMGPFAILLAWGMLIPLGVVQVLSSFVLGWRLEDGFRKRYAISSLLYALIVIASISSIGYLEPLVPVWLGVTLMVLGWAVLPLAAAAYYLYYTRTYYNAYPDKRKTARSEDYPDILDV